MRFIKKIIDFLLKIFKAISLWFFKTKLGQWHIKTAKYNWLKHVIVFGAIYWLGVLIFMLNGAKNIEVVSLLWFFIIVALAILFEYAQKGTRTGTWSLKDIMASISIAFISTSLIIIF